MVKAENIWFNWYKGHINRTIKYKKDGKGILFQLKFAKKESLKLLKTLSERRKKLFRKKISKIQAIRAQVEELADSSP